MGVLSGMSGRESSPMASAWWNWVADTTAVGATQHAIPALVWAILPACSPNSRYAIRIAEATRFEVIQPIGVALGWDMSSLSTPGRSLSPGTFGGTLSMRLNRWAG
jgi:hypothetical protein